MRPKERSIWVYSLVFVSIIFIASFIFTVSVSSFESDTSQQRYYRLLQDTINTVRDLYVDPDKVSYKTLIYGAINGMLKSLDDPHSAFLAPQDFEKLKTDSIQGEFGGLGIFIGIRDNWLTVISPIEDTPAWRLGLKPGDKIIEINGVSTEGITVEEAVEKLRGLVGSEVTISIFRKNEIRPRVLTLKREKIKIKTVKYTMMDDGIGFLRLTQFSEVSTEEIRNAVKDLKKQGMKKLILDLRMNPGGVLEVAQQVSDIFIDKGIIVFTRGRYQQDRENLCASTEQTLLRNEPVDVLIDKGSASASEIVAGALKDTKRATLIGVTTYGKGSVQQVIPLRIGSEVGGLKLTTAKYYTPSGKNIHNIGIKPDIEIDYPEITIEETYMISKIREGKYIENFVNKFKPFKDSDVDQFVRQLADENIKISRNMLMMLIHEEEYKFSIPPVYQLDTDVQLQKAVEHIKTVPLGSTGQKEAFDCN